MMTSSTNVAPVTLWVKAEPFTYGALPVSPHSRLSFNNIKKTVAYAKTKGKSGFPRLSYLVWKHIACNKLQLPEDLAWNYFLTFDLVTDTPVEQRFYWDQQFSQLSSPEELDKLRAQRTVPTLQFVLFLYIQHLHKISLRSSLVSSGEEWPLRARSPDLEGRSTPTGSKGMDEHSHMMFLLNNLTDVLELLVESESYGGGSAPNDAMLSLEAMEALSFLIAGSVDKNRTIRPVHEIAVMPQVQQKSGFSKISRSFLLRSLQSWLRSHITQNPFGLSACIASGRRLSWPLAGESKDWQAEGKRGRIATNALFVPKEQMKGNKIIIMSGVGKQTVARCSGTLEGASVKIHRCHYSYLYLLSPVRSVSIEKSRHTTIVLGAVETTVHINGCDQVTVIAACRRLIVSNSTGCTFYLLTPTRPLICSGSEGLVFGPYHTFYPKLEQHLRAAGITTALNYWDKPFCLSLDHHDEAAVWELLAAKDFYIFTIPFEMEGDTKALPAPLPTKYQKALAQRERQIDIWQRQVKDAGLTKEQRKVFQSVVESRFQDWLDDTGHRRQLDGLVVPPTVKTKK